MTISLSKRVQSIQPSATLAIAARAGELKAQGKRIISLSVGEPDFDTPLPIKQAAIDAINQGYSKYTPVGGLPELKQAIVNKFKDHNQLNYTFNQIIVCAGAKQCLYNAMQALLNPGDEVIIPAPFWVSYPDMALLADAKPIIIKTEYDDNFKLTASALKKAITPKTRILILNSPSNPTGFAYSKQELTALADVLLEYPDITILSDDIYEYILWSFEKFTNIVNVCPELYDRTIVINGVSKAYAMTGWRIGYAAGDETIIKAMTKIQSQSTSNPNAIAQKAAQYALEAPQNGVKKMISIFKERHDYAHAKINEVPGMQCRATDGAFYLFVDVTAVIKKLKMADDIAFAEFLLNKVNVAVIPGTAFGIAGFIRISVALDKSTLGEAIDRIKSVC